MSANLRACAYVQRGMTRRRAWTRSSRGTIWVQRMRSNKYRQSTLHLTTMGLHNRREFGGSRRYQSPRGDVKGAGAAYSQYAPYTRQAGGLCCGRKHQCCRHLQMGPWTRGKLRCASTASPSYEVVPNVEGHSRKTCLLSKKLASSALLQQGNLCNASWATQSSTCKDGTELARPIAHTGLCPQRRCAVCGLSRAWGAEPQKELYSPG